MGAKPRAKPIARADAGQKGGRSRSPAKADAARANGEKGGRPAKHSYPEVFRLLAAQIDAALGDPIKLAALVQEINLRALNETLMDRGSDQLNQQIRLISKLVLEAVPYESMKRFADANLPDPGAGRKGKAAAVKPKGPTLVSIDPTAGRGRTIRG